jgi:hypothetical protein
MKATKGRGLSHLVKTFASMCVVIGTLFSTSKVYADQIAVTYEVNGTFRMVKPGNPWGVGDWSHSGLTLPFDMQLTFLMPETDDLLPNPVYAKWNTTGSAFITANGKTVEYGGPTTIWLSAVPDGEFRQVVASIRMDEFYVLCLMCFPPFKGFPNDSVENLLNLGGAVDVRASGCFTDLDYFEHMSFVSAKPVPETGATSAMLGVSLLGLLLIWKRFSRYQR